MRFDDTLAASFPAFAADMDPAYRNVTVTQLLSHTAGLPPLTDDKDLPPFMAVIATAHGVKAQRAAIARKYLAMPPASKAGEFEYSNLGFIIAGAIAEAHTGKILGRPRPRTNLRAARHQERGLRHARLARPHRSTLGPSGQGRQARSSRSLKPRRRQPAGAWPRRNDQYRSEGLAALCPGPTRRRARPRQSF